VSGTVEALRALKATPPGGQDCSRNAVEEEAPGGPNISKAAGRQNRSGIAVDQTACDQTGCDHLQRRRGNTGAGAIT
jgi:hypothetical protein